MERATIDGADLEYEVSGTGEPVLCIHGAFIADTFRPLLTEARLAERYRLIFYHRRGYAGSSRAVFPVSVISEAADCHALLRHLGVNRAHIVGHSYGGAVALQLALDSPEMVHSLALLEPALMIGTSAQGYRETLARATERYREIGAETALDEFLKARWQGYRPTLDRALPGAFAQAVSDAATSFKGEFPGLVEWQFGELEAQRIRQPTLSVIGGESARLWPRFGETHHFLLTMLPDVEGYVVPGATHFLQVQNPQAVADAIAAFWARHPMTP